MVPTRTNTGGFGHPAAGSSPRHARGIAFSLGLALTLLGTLELRAADALQFDVFLGYGGQPTGSGGVVREIGWSTLGCEVQNPGPPFQATFEFSPGAFDRRPTYRLLLELPTNTRKRFTLPIFTGGSFVSWSARLLDERGRTRAESSNLQPQSAAWESLLLGALPRTFGGLPVLPQLTNEHVGSSLLPRTVRLLPELFPDNPIALEGLNAIYLNTDRASELSAPQAGALIQWLLHGGHLILAVEDPNTIRSLPWLESLVPLTFTFSSMTSIRPPTTLLEWGYPLTIEPSTPHSVTPDSTPGSPSNFPKYNPANLHQPDLADFTSSTPSGASTLQEIEFPVAHGTITDGRTLLTADDHPLIVRAQRGRGTITVLTFSSEREPFRSWDGRAWFWARLLQLPPAWFAQEAIPQYGGTSIDGLFGVLLDSRQIRTLPVAWLLLLLAAYLAVIGPLDRILLRRWRREMWTWISFPAYVACFSLLIYYVGFRLRAGDTEWNELHLVDFLPAQTAAPWRGRTYASLYSPVTASYALAHALPNATLRGEWLGYNQPSGNLTVTHRDSGFSAELAVPVWTSQLIVSDWSHSNAPPYSAQILGTSNRHQIVIQNHLDHPLRGLRLAFRGRLHELGDLEPQAHVEYSLSQVETRAIHEFIFQGLSPFFAAVQQRQLAFGSDNRRWPEPDPALLTAASFPAHAGGAIPLRDRQFVAPADFDLSPAMARGDAILFAWVPDYAPIPTLRNFPAVRTRQNTLFRLNLPLGYAPNPQP